MFKNLNLKHSFQISNFKFQIFLVVLVVLVVFPKKALAKELSLGVYPPLIRIQAVTPDDIKTPLTIQNQSDNPISLKISFRPFTASSKTNGEVSFITDALFDKLIEDKKIAVLDGDSPVSEIEVDAKQSKTLSLSINLSQEEKASDYYFSILFVSQDSMGQSSLRGACDEAISDGDCFAPLAMTPLDRKSTSTTAQTFISMGVATNVLLSVNPKGDPKVNIEEFSTSSLPDQGPVPFKLRVKNKGEYAVGASGDILITNMFGQTVGKIDIPSSYVLKNTSRILPGTNWEEKFLLGYYTATLNLKLDNNQPFITKTISFIAIPFQSAVIIISVLCLFLLIRTRIKAKPRLTR